MPPEEIRTYVRAIPFVPFRLHLSDGRVFEVRHPDNLLLTTRAAVVGVYSGAGEGAFPERTEVLALIHVVSIEAIGQTAQP